MMAKPLILFYSLQGSTRKVAQYLSKELEIPMEELKLKNDFKPDGISKYVFGGRQAVMGSKPPILPVKSDLAKYDTIILGSPVWAGRFTPALKTLLEKGLLKNKRIFFYYVSGGGPGKTDGKIQSSTKIHNTLVSTYAMTSVDKDFENQKQGVLNWARKAMLDEK